MKRIFFILLIIFVAENALSEVRYIQTRQAVVRSEPKFYATKVTSLSYGNAVQTLGDQNGWVKISVNNKTGYLPLSSITEQRIVFSDREAKKVSADPSDVVLAGKGFSPSVEAQYKRSGTGGRFDLVDKMESSCKVSDGELSSFVKSGGLKG